ncbi:MAG: formylglycine-generating enzyme family protein [Enhydrobacter sp.]|nr:formylglycine-generating enzyme family protein [Enhydrobacter sp.]
MPSPCLSGSLVLAIAIAAVPFSATSVLAQASERVAIGAFAIDGTEVTISRFRAFATATGLTTAADRDGGGFEYAGGWVRRPGWNYAHPQGQPGNDDEPATHVSWHEASRYCAHAGGRLPSLAEWRAAAYTESRAQPTDGFIAGRTYAYPVGDRPDGMNNNRRAHVAVGTTARGVNGLYDMGANVWEWVADRRGDDALTAGGSWWYGPEQARAEGAQWKAADFYAVYVGFRCAYDGRG